MDEMEEDRFLIAQDVSAAESDDESFDWSEEAERLRGAMSHQLEYHSRYSGAQGETYHNPTDAVAVSLDEVQGKSKNRTKLVRIYMDESGQYLRSAFPKMPYSGHRVKQLMRWLSTAIQLLYGLSQEVQCYFLAEENQIVVGINDDSRIQHVRQELDDESLFDFLIKSGTLGPQHALSGTSRSNQFQRALRHLKKLGMLREELRREPLVPEHGNPLFDVAPEVPNHPGMHAEAKIWYYLGREPLNIDWLGGIKPPCVACAVTIFDDDTLSGIVNNPTAFMRAGSLWNTADAMQGTAAKLEEYGTDDLETRRADIIRQMLSVPTTIRYNRTVDYGADQSSDDEAEEASENPEKAKFMAAYAELKQEAAQLPVLNWEDRGGGNKIAFVRGMRSLSLTEEDGAIHIKYVHRSGMEFAGVLWGEEDDFISTANDTLMIQPLVETIGESIPSDVWEVYDEERMKPFLYRGIAPGTAMEIERDFSNHTLEEVEMFINYALEHHCLV